MNTKPLILVYVDHPMCSLDCADATVEVLNFSGLYNAQMVGPSSFPALELNEEILSTASCLVFPGGEGDVDQFDNELSSKSKLIQDYVANGGRYLGICMGSYFAGSHFFNLLKGLDSVQYIKRKRSCTKRRGPVIINLNWNGSKERPMYFHDGAAFIPSENVVVDGTVVGKYANGDIAAFIQPHQRGKVGVIGPHPEAPKWWYYSQSRIKEGWKSGIQHELLLSFVQTLLE